MKIDVNFAHLKFEAGEEVFFDIPSIKRVLRISSSKFLKASLQLEAVFARVGHCEARLLQLCHLQPFSGRFTLAMEYESLEVIGKINLTSKDHGAGFSSDLKHVIAPLVPLAKMKGIPVLRFDVEKNHSIQKKFNAKLN